MTPEQLKSDIQIREHDLGDGTTEMTAELVVRATTRMDNYCRPPELRGIAKEHLRRKILRMLFDDTRNALLKAVDEVIYANPHDFNGVMAARQKLMEAAQYQPRKESAL
jgi:hypothetical protein